jgi:NAD(P)-dependent dehydrogenase (short-subunit alcohol dehydrogenase family)
MDLELGDKVAVLTGASKGIGYASARALAREGARVAICARGAEGLERAAEVLTVQADRIDNTRELAVAIDPAKRLSLSGSIIRVLPSNTRLSSHAPAATL